MTNYLAVLTILLLMGMVISKVLLLRRKGIAAMQL